MQTPRIRNNRIDKRLTRREAAQFRARRAAQLDRLAELELPAAELPSIYGPMRVTLSAAGNWEVR